MRSLSIVVIALFLQPSTSTAQTAYVAHANGKVRAQPYDAYTVIDSLGRTVNFYLSETTTRDTLPLIVYVHGSGHGSHFTRVGDRAGDRIVPMNGHATLADVSRGRARVLIVEKPGVTMYDRDDQPASVEFRREHALERWVEAVVAATIAARELPGVDARHILVIGHSEGELVAARVASRLPSVSHVGILAGGGPSQLFDLRLLARAGEFFASVSPDPAEREAYVLAQWDSILAAPDAADRDFFGHTYRRWSSFLRTSPIAELRTTQARVFMAQGARDRAVSRESFDALHSELLGMGRRPVAWIVPDADHSFAVASSASGAVDGWTLVLSRVVDWFKSTR